MATASEKFMVPRDRIAFADPELACAWARVVGSSMDLCGEQIPFILTYALRTIGITLVSVGQCVSADRFGRRGPQTTKRRTNSATK